VAKAAGRVEDLQARLDDARRTEQAKREAAQRAAEEDRDAAAAKDRAARAAQEAAWSRFPVSVFVSRKTQRLYVRKGNNPVFEGPVTIRDPHKPIGTFVFTAVDRSDQPPEMRWSVLAMYRNPTRIASAAEERGAGPGSTDVAAASAALDRIGMNEEALDIVSEVVLPGSSLIVSDEGPSRETGKDTDFVVVMSNEPQGALKIRQREPRPSYDDDWDRGPPWGRSPWGGGGPFFWKW
jgi:hypothetical protein